MITVYIFYLKSNGCRTLYAYTDNKDIANEFKNQRNMNSFILCKKKIDKNEFKNTENMYRKYKLSYGNFYTKTDIYGKRTGVKVLCTWNEEESIIMNSERLWESFSPSLFDTRIFKNEYIKPLEKLLFIKFYCFYKIKYVEYADYFYNPYYSSFGPVEAFIIEEFQEKYSYDELKLFLKFFKHTFDNSMEEESI